MSLTTRKEAATLQQPDQLTLWPDDALPGQLPLFNRSAVVQPDAAFPHCNQLCEAITACLFPDGCGLHCEGVLPDILTKGHLKKILTLPFPAWFLIT